MSEPIPLTSRQACAADLDPLSACHHDTHLSEREDQ